MNVVIISLFAILFEGCKSQKSIMDSWMGHPKVDMVAKWGPPNTTESDGSDGTICTWLGSPSVSNGTTTYAAKLVYFDHMGIAYKWAAKNETTPPTQSGVKAQ